jgi:hypothetical protein
MAAPLSSVFHGDITLEVGSDTTAFGFGDISINRRALVNGTENSTGPTNGALIVTGGAGISQTANFGQNINVLSGLTNLTETHIDTTNGPVTVTGGNAVVVSVGASSSFTSTTGSMSVISSNNTALISGGLNSVDAVKLSASDAAGGINVISGGAGQIALTSGSGGIQEVTSNGNISLTANNGSGQFTVNSSAGNQNLTLAVSGATDSQVLIQSAGVNATLSAIAIKSTNTAGNIVISNASGLGAGSISALSGSGGFSVTTNTGGSIGLLAQAAASSFSVASASASQNLTIGVSGATDSKLILQSEGTNSTSAILIKNTNTAGSISITQPASSSGKISLTTGSGGLLVNTQVGGALNATANGASSQIVNATTNNSQNLTVAVTGNTDSKLILSSTGTGNQAVSILATGTTGGIFASAAGSIQINTSDASNGINIGTLTTTPVKIGTNTSTTTIYGNLDVRGTTTTIESQVVQIADNIIEINSAPGGSGNSGVAHNRYQSANDIGTGDVVADVSEYNGTAQAGTTTSITLSSSDTNLDNFYNGYWVKIVSGTGANQVRRIKSYTATTKVASIYTTADQTGVLTNPTPVEGLNFTTAPDATSVYALYSCQWIIAMWDETTNQYSVVCSPMVHPDNTPTISHYVDMHIGNLIANQITATSINGTLADTQILVTLTDNSTAPVTITGFPLLYGIYTVMIRPTSSSSARTSAIFMIGRNNSVTSKGTVTRLIGIKGVDGENLNIQWNANSYPQLLYNPAPGVAGTTQYTLKIIGV